MNPIPNPMVGRRAFACGVERLLKLHQHGMMLPGQPGHDFLLRPDPLAERGPVLSNPADRKAEGLTQHQVDFGIGLFGLGQEFIVNLLVFLQGHISVVINSDEDAENVRLEIECVLLPTFFQVSDLVPTDAPVDEGQVEVREGGAILGGDDEHVAVAQDVVRVLVPATIAVRNGVALKEDAGAVLKDGDWLDGNQRRTQRGSREEERRREEVKTVHVVTGRMEVRSAHSKSGSQGVDATMGDVARSEVSGTRSPTGRYQPHIDGVPPNLSLNELPSFENMAAILLVEDNEDDVVLIERAFQRAGLRHLVSSVRSGATAIAYLRGDSPYHDRLAYPLPDLVLLDIKMPGIDGFQVLRWIRSNPEFARLVVVMLTSSDEIRDVNLAYHLGANSFLVKPLDFWNAAELARSISKLAGFQ